MVAYELWWGIIKWKGNIIKFCFSRTRRVTIDNAWITCLKFQRKDKRHDDEQDGTRWGVVFMESFHSFIAPGLTRKHINIYIFIVDVTEENRECRWQTAEPQPTWYARVKFEDSIPFGS